MPVAFFLACGTGGDTSGPPQNAPFAGTGGYTKIRDVFVVLGPADLTDPSVLTDSANGPFVLWVTRGGVEIDRTEVPSVGYPRPDATPLRVAISPTEAWEGGSVAKPSVERDGTGYHMAYEAGGGIIALADSTDGENWTGKRMLGPGHSPSLVHGVVFYDDGTEILRAPSGTTPMLHVIPGTNADVHVRQTPGDRPIWQMFFNCTGRDQISVAVCFAGSYDGENFSTNFVPILQPDLPSEQQPTGFIDQQSAVLFFAQVGISGKYGIGAATAP